MDQYVNIVLQLSQDVIGQKWGLLVVALAGLTVQLLSQESRFPISMPASWNTDRWKPVAVLVAGTVYTELAAVLVDHTMTWQQAVVAGVKTSMWTYGLFALVIKAAFKGNVPKALRWIAMMLPDPKEPPAPPPDLPVSPSAAQIGIHKKG